MAVAARDGDAGMRKQFRDGLLRPRTGRYVVWREAPPSRLQGGERSRRRQPFRPSESERRRRGEVARILRVPGTQMAEDVHPAVVGVADRRHATVGRATPRRNSTIGASRASKAALSGRSCRRATRAEARNSSVTRRWYGTDDSKSAPSGSTCTCISVSSPPAHASQRRPRRRSANTRDSGGRRRC